MTSLFSKEEWLKGVIGLEYVKNALVPSLKRHYSQKASEWNTDDDHLTHLLNLGAIKEVKQIRQLEGRWYVNCSVCRSLLKKIEMSHRQPARLMWMNNQSRHLCPKEYRLARIFMPSGNEMTSDYSDLDALAVLEILKNDLSFRHSYNEILCLILFRNRLMHSSSNCINPDELEAAFSTMKKLLEEDKFKNLEECKAAVKELDKLQQVNVICEVDESNEIWKLAKSIQKQAREDYEEIATPSFEVLHILLIKMLVLHEKEKMQQQKLVSELLKSGERIKYERSQREYEQRKLEIMQEKASALESQLDATKYQHQIDMQKSNKKKEILQKEVEDLTAHTPSFTERVAKGTATGTGIGLFGGPAGAAIGATAGGVVGGISYLWDKIRN